MKNLITRFANDEDGATAIEYGLIAALIAVAIIASVTALGKNVSTSMAETSACMEAPNSAACKAALAKNQAD